MPETLNKEPNISVKYGHNNKTVRTAVQLISNQREKKKRDKKNEDIMELLDAGFTIAMPEGPRRIHSKLLAQTFLNVINRSKPLDWTLHASGRDEKYEKVTTDGVTTVMHKGGYASSLMGKQGVFFNKFLFGDGFQAVGANDDERSQIPIEFSTIANSNVFVDPYCTEIRGGKGKSATQLLILFPFSWSEAIRLFPKLEKIGGKGKIPRTLEDLKDTNQTDGQVMEQDTTTEIAYFFDISNLNYTIFAGSACTVLEEYNGSEGDDKYPFWLDEEPYIPVLQYIGIPAAKGFYNYGIGDIVYELALVSQQLMNKGIIHADDNALPFEILNVPKNKASDLINKLRAASELRANGMRGFVPMEYDGQSQSGVSVQSLTSNSLVNEWKLLFDMLIQELKRFGINIDEVARGSDVTAAQIISEEEAANSFVKQSNEWDAATTEMAVRITMDLIEEYVPTDSDLPLNMTTKVEDESGNQVHVGDRTLGEVADELRKHNYFARVNSRSGATPSNVLKQAQVVRMLNSTPPNTPAHFKLLKQFAELNDRDLSLEDFGYQQGGQPASAAATGQAPDTAIPAGTERNAINARSAEREPAF